MRRHNKITSRKSHYGKQTIRNLVAASNCLSGIHSITWGVREEKKPQLEAGASELLHLSKINNYE